MRFNQFNSTEEMVAALRAEAAHALADLHPAQRSLTFGGHWVRFVDIPTRHIEFGRICTEYEVADGAIRAGDPWPQVVAEVQEVSDRLDQGHMFGIAHSRWNTDGEYGTTHKAHVWPIEDRLFVMAKDVDFQIDRLDDVGRILLDIAFRAQRAHVLPDRKADQ